MAPEGHRLSYFCLGPFHAKSLHERPDLQNKSYSFGTAFENSFQYLYARFMQTRTRTRSVQLLINQKAIDAPGMKRNS